MVTIALDRQSTSKGGSSAPFDHRRTDHVVRDERLEAMVRFVLPAALHMMVLGYEHRSEWCVLDYYDHLRYFPPSRRRDFI